MALRRAEALVRQFPSSALLWNLLGLLRAQTGNSVTAEQAFRAAIDLAPNFTAAYYNFGNFLQEKGKIDESIENYRRALEIQPDLAEVCNNLGNALNARGDFKEAVAICRRAIRLGPGVAGSHISLGNALRAQGEPDEAIASYRRAIAIDPQLPVAHNNLGIALSDIGDTDGAVASFRRALELRPDYAECHRHLSAVVTYVPGDPHIDEMRQMLHDKRTPPHSRCNICFALGKALEDVDELDAAFAFFAEGNAIRKQLLGYNIEFERQKFQGIRDNSEAIRTAQLRTQQSEPACSPIFVVGMPRSGTTLVEQIISSHSAVHGAGELPYLARFGEGLATGIVPPTAENLMEFATNYASRTAYLANGHSRFTDKQPTNFKFIGLIAKAFPDAKIVHVTRDPRATCWSCFKHFFASRGLGFTCNLSDLVEYFEMYSDLMTYWTETLPHKVYELNYDALTENPKQTIPGLIDHLGLEWEEACLYPERNQRGVATASRHQVRRGIYRGSSAAWRRFEPHLVEAFDQLVTIGTDG